MTTIAAPTTVSVPPAVRADEPAAPGRHRRSGAARGVSVASLSRRLVRFAIAIVVALAAAGSVALAAFIIIGGVGFSPVLSPSMRPAFAPGDLVVTKPEPVANLRVGQVVVLPVPGEAGQRYVHRIIRISYQKGRPVVQTKGDANPKPEDFRLRITSATVPVVVHVVPHAGRLALLFRAGTWRIVGIALIGGLLLLGLKRALLDR